MKNFCQTYWAYQNLTAGGKTYLKKGFHNRKEKKIFFHFRLLIWLQSKVTRIKHQVWVCTNSRHSDVLVEFSGKKVKFVCMKFLPVVFRTFLLDSDQRNRFGRLGYSRLYSLLFKGLWYLSYLGRSMSCSSAMRTFR